MKRVITLLTALLLLIATAMPASAADGNATYSGDAGSFIFAPGSEYSPTDLFPNFKDVMPGDTLTQRITVKNDASKKVKVKIYIRSLGAHAESREFLSKLHLWVQTSADNNMAYMFDAAANETAGLTDWVYLGTLYSGGKVNLDVILDVPTTLSNDYQEQIGYSDWEFRIEEYPVEPDDPTAPQTGDGDHITLLAGTLCGSAALILLLLLWRKKQDKTDESKA